MKTQADREAYRLIVTRRRGTEVLLSSNASGCSVPQLEIVAGSRIAEQLAARVKATYGLPTYCLLIHSLLAESVSTTPARYAVMETVPQGHETRLGARWFPLEAAQSDETLDIADRSALRSSLAEINRYIAEPEMGPFARPGWMEELFGWAEDQIEPLGLRLTGEFQQHSACPTCSLVRIETTGPAVWFKATGEPNKGELRTSVALGCLFPSHVPRILGVHPAWNGWLSEEILGSTLDDFADVGAWAEAAKSLAKLQIASVTKTDALLDSGCKDLRLEQLANQIDPFLTRMGELMAMQTKQPPQILTDSEISVLGDCLRGALSELQQYPLPTTLGQLDLNPGNILLSSKGCCFLDWAEGCVSHPFFTFEYLLEHSRRSLPQTDHVAGKLAAAYLEPWRPFFSPEALAQALAVSPLLAVFAYAIAGKKWCSPETLQNPALAGYFRGLTRRAYRESTKVAARSGRCLA
jgi:hypothetical protein